MSLRAIRGSRQSKQGKGYHVKQKSIYICFFSLKIFMSDERNELKACEKHSFIDMKGWLQSWYNDGYCGTIMIGGRGDIRHDVPPTFWLEGTRPPRPPCGGAHVL